MGLVTLPNSLTTGTAAKGSEVLANDQALQSAVNGNIDDVNVSSAAGINGSKLSNVAGSRVPTDRIEDDAITAAKLADSPGVDASRAVTTDHIRDAAVTAAKVGANAILLSKVKTVTFSWTPGGSIASGAANSTSTGVTAAQGLPVGVEIQFAGVPTTALSLLVVGLWLNTGTNTYHLTVGNPSALSGPSLVGVTFKATFVAAS